MNEPEWEFAANDDSDEPHRYSYIEEDVSTRFGVEAREITTKLYVEDTFVEVGYLPERGERGAVVMMSSEEDVPDAARLHGMVIIKLMSSGYQSMIDL